MLANVELEMQAERPSGFAVHQRFADEEVAQLMAGSFMKLVATKLMSVTNSGRMCFPRLGFCHGRGTNNIELQ